MEGRLDHVGDLRAHELVALEQGVTQRLDDLGMRLHDGLCRVARSHEERVELRSGVLVPEHLVDQAARQVAAAGGRDGDEGGTHAAGPDHLGADVGGGGQVRGRTGRHLVEPALFSHHSAHGDLQKGTQFLAALGEAFLGVGVLQQPEGVTPLHDGEHVKLTGLPHEVGHRRVAGLMGGHPIPFVGGVDGLVGHAELHQHLGLGHVGHGHGGAAVGQRDDQRLVHQALQGRR